MVLGCFQGESAALRGVVERIQEYSRKSLTNPLDILNDIIGILRAFESSKHRICHYFGVSILPAPPGILNPGAGRSLSIHWSSAMGFLTGLC